MEELLQALEEILRGELREHESLLRLAQCNREAIRRADTGAVGRICADERSAAGRLEELEHARQELATRLTRVLDPKAREPMTLRRIVEAVGERRGVRLGALSARLHETVAETRRASAVARAAAEALARYMAGVVRSLESALGGATVYTRTGRMRAVISGRMRVDLRS
jgi:hypothetical protein